MTESAPTLPSTDTKNTDTPDTIMQGYGFYSFR
jgi:hypothetical protein